MIVKKRKNNEYLLTESGVWVRNFTKKNAPALDINDKLYTNRDHAKCHLNEMKNFHARVSLIDHEQVKMKKVVIVSDGFDFENKQHILAELPDDVNVIATNKALRKWKLVGKGVEKRKKIDCYVVNNPYEDCMTLIDKSQKYWPRCVASTRTYPNFVEEYRGDVFFYVPTYNKDCVGPKRNPKYKIDDYRNPICAALGLAYQFQARKIMLFCCDDSFEGERPGSSLLKNGLYQYPQQAVAHSIIDGYFKWFKEEEIELGDHSSGANYVNAAYINSDSITHFFEEEEDDT